MVSEADAALTPFEHSHRLMDIGEYRCILTEGRWDLEPDPEQEVRYRRALAEQQAALIDAVWGVPVFAEWTTEEAWDRAEALLLEHLDEGQRRDWREDCLFHVNAPNGHVYKVSGRGDQLVTRTWDGAVFCLQPEARVPAPDACLARKLWLEADEAGFLERANRMDGFIWGGGEWSRWDPRRAGTVEQAAAYMREHPNTVITTEHGTGWPRCHVNDVPVGPEVVDLFMEAIQRARDERRT